MDQLTIVHYLNAAIAIAIAAVIGCLVFWPSYPRVQGVKRLGLDPGWLGLRLAESKRLYEKRGRKIIQDMYMTNKHAIYYIQTSDIARFVIPPQFLPELRMLPEKQLSHRHSIVDRWAGEYNGMDTVMQSHLHADVCRVQLTQHLAQLVPLMNQELQYGMDTYFREEKLRQSFKAVPAYGFILHLTAHITSRVLVGLPTCRDPQWMKVIYTYPALISKVASDMEPYPKWVRWAVAPFLPSTQQIKQQQQVLHNLLDPLIAQRRPMSAIDDSKPLDVLQWLIDQAKGPDRTTHGLILKLMMLTLAALHTSTISATHALLELCQRPASIIELREEARAEWESNSHSWSLAGLRRLRKLDSFMKESDRLNHQGNFGFNRKIMAPITLSSGITLPAGYYLNLPSASMDRDDAFFNDAVSFDPARFVKLQDKAGDATLPEFQYSGLSKNGVTWGAGRSNCPGRWYAEVQIKLVLVNILLHYDVSFINGESSKLENIRAQSIQIRQRIAQQ